MMKTPVQLAALSALVISLAVPLAVAQPTPVDRSKDLKKLEEWIELDQSFTPVARQTALQAVAALAERSS